jgi:cytoskeleton protein RodZ
MGHFGQELRRERETRGIALEAITSETKINGRHLLSLEEGQFASLPGGVLSKGIVRGYARVVGLDEEDCLRRYVEECEHHGLKADDDSGWTAFAANVGRNRKGDFGRPTKLQWAGVALLLTLLAVFGWYVAHFVQERMSEALTGSRAQVCQVTQDGHAFASQTTFAGRTTLAGRAAFGALAD